MIRAKARGWPEGARFDMLWRMTSSPLHLAVMPAAMLLLR